MRTPQPRLGPAAVHAYLEKAGGEWRTMATNRGQASRIVVDPKVMLGKPVIRGTRITVEIVLEKLAAGQTIEEVLEDYPRFRREDVLAGVKYASHAVGAEESRPLPF